MDRSRVSRAGREAPPAPLPQMRLRVPFAGPGDGSAGCQIGHADDMMPLWAAIRWTLRDKHECWRYCRAPTGDDDYVLESSRAKFGPWGLRRELVLLTKRRPGHRYALQTR